jgi:hypothetical protein
MVREVRWDGQVECWNYLVQFGAQLRTRCTFPTSANLETMPARLHTPVSEVTAIRKLNPQLIKGWRPLPKVAGPYALLCAHRLKTLQMFLESEQK